MSVQYRSFDTYQHPEYDWSATHENYDGDEDARHFSGFHTRVDLMEAIDDYWASHDVPRPSVPAAEREAWAGR